MNNKCYFEVVSRFNNDVSLLPKRGTKNSAGYDLVVAEDITISPYMQLYSIMAKQTYNRAHIEDSLDQVAEITKLLDTRPTLVSTGVKCHLPENKYLELSVRSSTPLKYWLIMANSVGIIDADYYNNPGNEGEIFIQLINLSPIEIKLHKGDVIAQAIIKTYDTVKDDNVEQERVGGLGSTTKT